MEKRLRRYTGPKAPGPQDEVSGFRYWSPQTPRFGMPEDMVVGEIGFLCSWEDCDSVGASGDLDGRYNAPEEDFLS